MVGLTRKQMQILGTVREHFAKHGIPPSLREIGRAIQVRSLTGVIDHLRALERKGYLVRGEGHRAMRLTDKVIVEAKKKAQTERAAGAEPVVYFAQSLDTLHIKIGWTVDLSERVRQLRADGDLIVLVTVPGARGSEHALHQRFAASQVQGEWFRPDPPLVACIAALRETATSTRRRRLGLPDESEGPSKKHCSLCGVEGHNARTCAHHADDAAA